MGRKKIPIKKLEAASQRRCTFKKRSEGIEKKAKELSIICDEEVLLLFREPKGQYHLCLGENSTFDGVVKKFLSDSQENHEKSRQNSIKMLKKSYKGDSHALNSLSLMDHGMMLPTNKEMDLEHIQEEISKIESQLGPLRNMVDIDKIERFDEIIAMENSIMELLAINEQQMVQLVEQQKSGCPDTMITQNERDNLQCFTSTSVPATNYQIDQRVATMLNATLPPCQRDNLQYFTSMSVPATNHEMDQQVATMVNPTPPYQRDSLQRFNASTSVRATNYQMDPQVATMLNHTSPYQRDSMASTSTTPPMLTYPSMAEMEQQARLHWCRGLG